MLNCFSYNTLIHLYPFQKSNFSYMEPRALSDCPTVFFVPDRHGSKLTFFILLFFSLSISLSVLSALAGILESVEYSIHWYYFQVHVWPKVAVNIP